MHRFLAALFLMAVPGLVFAAATPRPAKLGQCVACHGEDGRSRVPGTPHLGGQDEVYLAKSLAAYRSGERKAQPMNSLANTLQASDITAIARWYATRPPVVGTPEKK